MSSLANLWWIVIAILVLISGMSLCFPVWLIKLMRASARRFEFRSDRTIDKVLSIDQKLYRHHRIAGLTIWLLSLLILYLIIFQLDVSSLTLRRVNPFGLQTWAFEAMMTVTLLVGVIGLCIGMVLMLRPSLLKPLESWGNRWVTTPENALDRDLTGDVIESWVVQHTRLFGLLVFLAASVIWVLVFGLQ